MINVVLCSADDRIQPILAGVLGPAYRVKLESNKDEVKKTVRSSSADVVVVDLDSTFDAPRDYQLFFDEIRDPRIPVVVMTGDGRRPTAPELVKCGVYDYISKPLSLVELKMVIQRACEHASLKKDVQ